MLAAGSTTDDGSITIRIEPDPLGAERYRWTLHLGPQIVLRSPHAYLDRDEAEQEAKRALERHFYGP